MTTEPWHLKREIPLALIFALFLQTVGAIWWAASMTQRMDQMERRMEGAAIRSQSVDNLVAQQSTQIAVLVERIDTQNWRIEETNDLIRQFLRLNGEKP